jgi:hypothetical protein
MTADNATNYWITADKASGTFFPGPKFTGIYDFNAGKETLFNNKITSVQINAASPDDKIQAGAAWNKIIQHTFLIQYIPGFGSFYREGKIIQKGFSVYTAVKLIDRSSFKWDSRLNVLFPDTKYKLGNTTQGFALSATSYKMQTGLQQHFRFDRFSAQLNGLAGTGRQTVDYQTGAATKKETEFILNYLSFGYDIPLNGNSHFKNFSVFAQARNLLADKKANDYYRLDRYAGLGASLAF